MAMSFRDKMLQNPTAVDVTAVIVQEKLLKLLKCKLIVKTSLEQQIESIVRSLDRVSDLLTEGSEKGKCQSMLLKAVYQTEDGIDLFRRRIADVDQTIGNRHLNMFHILWAKYLLWRCLHELESQITTLIPDYILQGSGSSREEGSQRHHSIKWDDLYSFEVKRKDLIAGAGDMQQLMKRMELKEEKNGIIVIVEGEEFDNTVLARNFFTQRHDDFDCCAWVNVSRIAKPQRVLRILLEQVSDTSFSKPDPEQPERLLSELISQALHEKTYLIVLDRVSNSDWGLLSEVCEILPDSEDGRGGRLLITTHDEGIAYYLDETPVELNGFQETEIKEFVKGKMKIAGKGFDDSTLENVAQAFTKKNSGSLPRLELMSGLIAMSDGLTEELINGIPDRRDLDHLFVHCYNQMGRELKPCLFYMALFPEGYLIPVRRLLRLWLCEGLLVVPPEAKIEPEDLGQQFLKELLIRGFIEVVKWNEDGRPKRVRVSTIIHDSICSRAVGTELLNINTDKQTEEGQHQQGQVASRLRWLAEHSDIKKLYPVAKIDHLRSFLSFNLRVGMVSHDIRLFLETMSGKGLNLLTVLDLEGVYKPNLDKVLGKLVLLKYLGLRSTALGSLPKSVVDLPYLETLDLKYTNITELPKLFWKKLRYLRHLYLNSYHHIDKSILSSLGTSTKIMVNLHTLSGVVVEAGTIEGLSNIKKLTKLGVMFQDHQDNRNAIGQWISSLTNLQILKLGIICSNEPSELPSNLILTKHGGLSKLYLTGKLEQIPQHVLPQNLITLVLSGSNIWSDDLINQLRNLTNLKVLKLLAKSFTGQSLRFAKGCLGKLRVLRLWKLEYLQRLELEDKLPEIKTIEIRSCRRMIGINGIGNVGSESTVLLQLIDVCAKFVDLTKADVNKIDGSKYKITVKMTKPILSPDSREAANAVSY